MKCWSLIFFVLIPLEMTQESVKSVLYMPLEMMRLYVRYNVVKVCVNLFAL
jgi:hypothetical protein